MFHRVFRDTLNASQRQMYATKHQSFWTRRDPFGAMTAAEVETLAKRAYLPFLHQENFLIRMQRWSDIKPPIDKRTGENSQRVRVAYITSIKAIDKRAILRNRARRRVSTALAQVLQGNTNQKLDLLLLIRAKALCTPYPELKEVLREALTRLRVTLKQEQREVPSKR